MTSKWKEEWKANEDAFNKYYDKRKALLTQLPALLNIQGSIVTESSYSSIVYQYNGIQYNITEDAVTAYNVINPDSVNQGMEYAHEIQEFYYGDS